MRDLSWRVYLLQCADGTLYCGCTNDLDKRLAAHARGRVKYTRGRLPVALAHVEPVADKSAALKREHAWKRLPRAEKLRRIAAAADAGSTVGTRTRPRARAAGRKRGVSEAETPHPLRRGRKFVIAKACGKLQD